MNGSYTDDIALRGKRRGLWRPRRASARPEGGAEAQRAEALQERRERMAAAVESLRAVFQPIIDLSSGEAVGVEALARIPAEPSIPPERWFAEATELGLGTQIELAALRVALESLPRLPSGLYMSLNASPETMLSPEFRSAISESAAERLVVEVMEQTEIRDYAGFGDSIADLRSNGVRLAIDDAGAGISSFLHIVDFHPDIIKLDVAVTRGIDADPRRQALGSALLTFGLNALDAGIIAEGIENERELATLRGLGYPFGQGYHLAPPAPVPDSYR
jgi:EAL domain-containing protein (putative c-di-GMP-specific phosphodiesterase class I)